MNAALLSTALEAYARGDNAKLRNRCLSLS